MTSTAATVRVGCYQLAPLIASRAAEGDEGDDVYVIRSGSMVVEKDIGGKPMIVRAWEQAMKSGFRVAVAAGDPEIVEAVEAHDVDAFGHCCGAGRGGRIDHRSGGLGHGVIAGEQHQQR